MLPKTIFPVYGSPAACNSISGCLESPGHAGSNLHFDVLQRHSISPTRKVQIFGPETPVRYSATSVPARGGCKALLALLPWTIIVFLVQIYFIIHH